MPIYKQETWSNRLLDWMRENKDTKCTIEELNFFTGITTNRIHASLYYFLRVKCVGCLPNANGEMEYFALPEEEDARTRVVRERKPEEEGSRKSKHGRKPRSKK